jgi:hypothetical protein
MTACSGLAALPNTDCAAVHANLSMSRTSGAERATEVFACTALNSSMASNGSLSFMGALPMRAEGVGAISVAQAGRPPSRAVVSSRFGKAEFARTGLSGLVRGFLQTLLIHAVSLGRHQLVRERVSP